MKPLTVSEVIEALRKLPQDLPVAVRIAEDGWFTSDVVTVYVGKVWGDPYVILE
jgi:hypothetical protein